MAMAKSRLVARKPRGVGSNRRGPPAVFSRMEITSKLCAGVAESCAPAVDIVARQKVSVVAQAKLGFMRDDVLALLNGVAEI